jgi:hypothetical protein
VILTTDRNAESGRVVRVRLHKVKSVLEIAKGVDGVHERSVLGRVKVHSELRGSGHCLEREGVYRLAIDESVNVMREDENNETYSASENKGEC